MKLTTRRALWAYTFLSLPMLLFIVFRILPLFQAFRMSMFTWHADQAQRSFVGLEHYRLLFQDAKFIQALANMGKYVALVVPGQVLIGLMVALMLHAIPVGKIFFRTVYFLPYVTPAVAIAWVWSFIFSPHLGIANVIVRSLGLPPLSFLTSPSQALPTVAFIIIWQYFGFHTIIFLAALNSIPAELYEAARMDGAGGWRLFRHITLPLINPVLVLSIIMATGSPAIGVLQLFTQVLNLRHYDPGGPLGSTMTIVLYMYQAGFKNFAIGYAAAIATVLFVMIACITLIQYKLTMRRT